jgi:DNA-binding IclR family transcriptional regulator
MADERMGEAMAAMVGKSDDDKGGQNLPGVAAASRALSVISAFRTGDRKLSLAELSRRTGLYKSTILRLMDSLEPLFYIQRLENGDYSLGSELVRLGGIAAAATDSYEIIAASLKRLVTATGESATFYVPRGEYRLALLREDSAKTVRDHIRVGALLPLDRGAAGHVLARARDSEILIWKSLGERDPDLAAVAGPVYEDGKLIGAIQVSGPISRLNEKTIEQAGSMVAEECVFLAKSLRSR